MLDLLYRKLIDVGCQMEVELLDSGVLSVSRFQTYVTIWYLIYRWIISICWLGIMLCSIGEFGSAQPIGNKKVWLMYLTNWNLVLGVTQSIIGVFLVSKRWLWQKNANNFNEYKTKCGKPEKMYWILYTITCTLSIGVTGSYWVLVYDPKLHQIDSLNIMLHVCNSVLIFADLCVTKVPLELRYFWWCTLLIVFYLICSILYYAAGGLDKQGNHYIYKMIDWEKPGITLLVSLGEVILLIIVHWLLCLITKLLEQKFKNHMKYIVELPTTTINEEKKFQHITFIVDM